MEGTERVFERLVRDHQDRIYALGLALTGNRHDAEEVAQDTFLRAYRALTAYPPDRVRDLKQKAWLHRIAVNVVRNRVRGVRPRLVELNGSEPDRGSGPEEDVMRRAEIDELAARVACLPARYREAVVLRHVQELSYAEVADALGQPVGTVKANVHRATVMIDLKRLGDVKAPAGFAERVLAQAGMADSYAVFETVLGPVYVAWNRLGVSAAMRSKSAAEFEEWFRKDVGRELLRVEAPAAVAAKIEDQLRGKRRLQFDLRGLTPFSQAVLQKTLEIPRGQVRPYGWIAREIGHPAAVRAVGTALANNPIPYFIPCHRVVRSDGVIGNYGGGGPEAKRNILTLEGVQLKSLETLARSGLRYEGVKSTKIFCFPTCYHGRHAREENFVFFHDEAEARAAGYRPCKDCRPAVA